jgi:fatty-acid desaturase
MKNELSKKGKVSLALSFCTFLVGLSYMYFVMDGRTKLNAQDTQFLTVVVIFISIFLIITIVDRSKTKGGNFSWKKFGIILLIVILFGLWRIAV